MKTKPKKKLDPKARAMAAAAAGRPESHAYSHVLDLARGLGLSFNFMARLDQSELDAGASTDLAMSYAVREFNLRHRREIFWAHPTTHQPGTAPSYYCLWEAVSGARPRACRAKFIMNGPFRVVLNRLHSGKLDGDPGGPWDMSNMTATATMTASTQPVKKWKFKGPGPAKSVTFDRGFEKIPKVNKIK